jgi:farnesyl-diphosphate farnesyltransferase
MHSRVYEMELGGNLLASVSRSFYLSIKVLPSPVRRVIALGYLLARATDTIADTVQAPVAARLENLDAFRRSLVERRLGGLPHLISPSHPGERLLLKRLPECLNWLEEQEEEDRADICRVLEDIIHGQELDLRRFSEADKLVALQTSAELEEYTYLVAGCVGKFWTRVSKRHQRNYSNLDEEALCRLGINFGKGLQLVNILRDLPADLRAGRCYLPLEQLREVGIEVESLLSAPGPARPIVDRWHAQAAEWLADGCRYIEALQPFRMRYACILPWKLGVETLARLKLMPALESAVRIKVPRSEVRMIMIKALAGAYFNSQLKG